MTRQQSNQNTGAVSCLSEAHVQRLLSHVREQADRARRDGASRAVVDEIIMLILCHAGLRGQELCALRIADTPAHHGRPELRVRDISGKSTRIVTMPQELVPTFQRFVRLYRKGARRGDPLLLSERGTSFGYMSLYSKVRRIGQEAGVAGLHPAAIRHAFLVRLYEKEQDLRFVQEQAGHARIKSTARHVRLRQSRQRCEGCNKLLPSSRGRKIDSGQLLCPACLRDLRNH